MNLTKKQIIRSLQYTLGLVFVSGLIAVGIIIGKAVTAPEVVDPYDKAKIALEAKQYGEAYYYLNKTIESDAENTTAYIQLAEILQMKGRDDEAIEILIAGVEKKVDKALLRDALVRLYLRTGDNQNVKTQLEALTSSTSESVEQFQAEYKYNLGVVFVNLGEINQAQTTFRTLSEDASGGDWYYRALFELAMYAVDDPATRDPLLATTGEDTSPVKSETASFLAKIEEAKAAHESRDLAEMNGWYGIILLENDRCGLALPYFAEAIRVGDTYGVYAKAHQYYGLCLHKTGDNEAAKTELETAIEEDPVDVQSYVYLTDVCAVLEDTACAEASYAKLHTVNPTNTDYIYAYYEYLLENGTEAEAMVQLEDYVSRVDDDTKKQASSRYLVIYYLDLTPPNTEKAAQYLTYLSQDTAEYHAHNGWIKHLNGENGENDIDEALGIDTYNAWAYYYKAVILSESGDDNAATQYAIKAVDYDFEGAVTPKSAALLDELRVVI